MKKVFLIVHVFICVSIAHAQTLQLENASFERDDPQPGIVPEGWINLGSKGETPPDVQPGSWAVSKWAKHGANYLGLVVRDNNTWEGIGQALDGYMMLDSVYTFSLYLAHSRDYSSISRMTGEEVKYTAPTILKIWGVNTITNEEELLATSKVIQHREWVRYTFTLKPTKGNFNEIDLMVYYAPGSEQKNGNLLLDKCSDIEPLRQSVDKN